MIVDDRRIFSKHEENRFPDEDEIVAEIRAFKRL